jgi:hypothetical protein
MWLVKGAARLAPVKWSVAQDGTMFVHRLPLAEVAAVYAKYAKWGLVLAQGIHSYKRQVRDADEVVYV